MHIVLLFDLPSSRELGRGKCELCSWSSGNCSTGWEMQDYLPTWWALFLGHLVLRYQLGPENQKSDALSHKLTPTEEEEKATDNILTLVWLEVEQEVYGMSSPPRGLFLCW